MIFLWSLLLLIALALAGLHLWSRSLARQARAAVPPVGQVQPVVGGTIHYVEMGPADAPVLLLIHGIAAQLQHYTYAMTDLLKDDFRVVVIDRPGSGYSVREVDEDGALPVQARMIAEFLGTKGIEAAHVAGHSLGGAVALALALDFPDKVKSLSLIAPLTHVEDVPPVLKGLELRSRLMRRVLANTLALPVGKLTAEKTLAFGFAPEPVPSDFMIRAAGILGLRPEAFVGASSDLAMLEASLPAQESRYASLEVPGGVLYGDGDAMLSPEVQGRSMTAFALDYEELPGRGHMLPITAPADTVAFIRRMTAEADALSGTSVEV